MEIINIIGAFLAQRVNLSPPAGRGLLKLAIKDELGPFKPYDILEYEDLKNVISKSLKQRLENLEIYGADSIIKELVNILNKNQSLLTMSKV